MRSWLGREDFLSIVVALLLPRKFALPRFASLLLWLLPASLLAAPIPDLPFWQDVAVRIQHAPELTNTSFKKLFVDKENVVYALTDKGVARVYDDTLTLDRSYRPLAGRVARDIALTPGGRALSRKVTLAAWAWVS